MIRTIKDTVHYLDHANVISKQEFARITFRRSLFIVTSAGFVLVLAWFVGGYISEGAVNLQALGLVLDGYAALVIAGATLMDRLTILHRDSLAPGAHNTTHAEQSIVDLKRTTDDVTGLVLLVIGFVMQIPATLI